MNPTLIFLCVILALLNKEPRVMGQAASQNTVAYVSKYRTWIPDTNSTFRPLNSSVPAYHHDYIYPIAPPLLSKFSLAVMPTSGDLLAFGGEQESEQVPNEPLELSKSNVVLRFQVEKHQWYNETLHRGSPQPPARLDHVGFAVGDVMYIHGGRNNSVMNDVWQYSNRSWKQLHLPLMPFLLGHSADVLFDESNGTVFLFGGINEEEIVSNNFTKIDLHMKTVTLVNASGQPPSPRAFHASAVMHTVYEGTMLFISGGADQSSTFSDLYVYYTKNNSWRLLSDGSSSQSYSFDNALIPALTLPPVMRHACVRSFPY